MMIIMEMNIMNGIIVLNINSKKLNNLHINHLLIIIKIIIIIKLIVVLLIIINNNYH